MVLLARNLRKDNLFLILGKTKNCECLVCSWSIFFLLQDNSIKTLFFLIFLSLSLSLYLCLSLSPHTHMHIHISLFLNTHTHTHTVAFKIVFSNMTFKNLVSVIPSCIPLFSLSSCPLSSHSLPHLSYSPLPTLSFSVQKGTCLPWASTKQNISSEAMPSSSSCIKTEQCISAWEMGSKKPAHVPRMDPHPTNRGPTNRENYTTLALHVENLSWFNAGFLSVVLESMSSH